MDKRQLECYARFAVQSGVNLQRGQVLIVDCQAQDAPFARLCAAEAYAAGAKDVVVHYADEELARLRIEKADIDVLGEVKPWRLARYMEYASKDTDVCRLAVVSDNPEIYKGLDAAKVDAASQAQRKFMRPWREKLMASRMQWSIVAVPSVAWAQKMFPQDPPQEAVEKLWRVIFKVCRIDTGDAAAAWNAHIQATQKRVKVLNGLALSALHLRAQNGTDLMVGLVDEYQFEGIEEGRVPDGLPFLPNIPSEEVFTAPHAKRVNGVVKSSMPYVYNGNLIEGITLRFERGEAVQASAEVGDGLLQQLLGADRGARRLGEIALVPAGSLIRQTGLLFYNTLFDENAACHIALGAGYPNSVCGAQRYTPGQLKKKGLNESLIHEDIMVGTQDMDIDGVLTGGEHVPVFRAGEWAL